MSKISLIIRKEYLRRVNKKSFLIFTFLTPILIACLVAVPLLLSTIKDSDAKKIGVVDATGKYVNLLKSNESYNFVPFSGDMSKYKNNEESEYYAFLVIDGDLLLRPDKITLFADKQVTTDLKGYISDQLNKALSNEKLASYNIPNLKEIIKESEIKLDIRTVKWSDDGKDKAGSAELATAIGLISTVMIYMFIFLYGAMVMRGVMEEKTSRIVEVLVSSVKPIELMMGKIIGIALVGLTQFLLWVIFSGGLFFVIGLIFGLNKMPDTTAIQGMNPAMQQMPNSEVADMMKMLGGFNFGEILFYFVLYFLGGYLLYASLFAAVGSAVDSETDTQQFMLPITIPIIFALYAGMYSAQNPDGPLAFWCSLIPFTSPIVMMVRLPFDVPLWQKILSLSLLILTFIGTTRLAAKIYRTGILMYGKKVSYKELWKWLKY
ncbi:MAG: ABC transporter permease [Bacteroidales bacterium]|nr:ABC transporter permease [Bacteroidales bacterium]